MESVSTRVRRSFQFGSHAVVESGIYTQEGRETFVDAHCRDVELRRGLRTTILHIADESQSIHCGTIALEAIVRTNIVKTAIAVVEVEGTEPAFEGR